MGLGTSIVVLAVGAILTFAVTTTTSHGVNIHDVGVILMIIGVLGFIASLVIWGPRTRRTVVEDSAGRRASVTQRDSL